jgi:hypothetical protein
VISVELASFIVSAVSCIAAVAAVIVALRSIYESKLPDVVVYLEHDRDNSCMNLVIKNFGKGVARNVSLHGFDYSMADPSKVPHLKHTFIERGIPVLVPEASRSTVIQGGASMKSHSEDTCNVAVSYVEPAFPFGTKTFSETFVLDYYSFSNSLYTKSEPHEIKEELHSIKLSIDELKSIQCDELND